MRGERRGIVWLVCWVALLSLSSADAWAGSLGDFGDSHREKSNDNDSGSSSDSDDDDDDSDDWGDNDDWGSSSSSSGGGGDGEWLEGCGLLMFYVLKGYTPDYRFTYGRAPYYDRGYFDVSESAYEEARYYTGDEGGALSEADRRRARYGYTRLRLDGWTTGQGDALGWGVFAKVGSTFTPALMFSYHEARELRSPESLGVGQLMIEPRFYVHEQFELGYSLGGNLLADEEEVLGVGPSLGLTMDLFPLRPLFIQARLMGHFPAWVPMLDVSVNAGLQFLTHGSIHVGWRRLTIRDGASLDLLTLGFGFNLGF